MNQQKYPFQFLSVMPSQCIVCLLDINMVALLEATTARHAHETCSSAFTFTRMFSTFDITSKLSHVSIQVLDIVLFPTSSGRLNY